MRGWFIVDGFGSASFWDYADACNDIQAYAAEWAMLAAPDEHDTDHGYQYNPKSMLDDSITVLDIL